MNDEVTKVPLDEIYPDEDNPRKPDEPRLALLALSLQKLGFVLPIHATHDGLILSGHQRYTVAQRLGLSTVPVAFHELSEKKLAGINILFNRSTNDFGAFDTGTKARENLSLTELTEQAEEFEDYVEAYGEDFYAYYAEERSIRGLGQDLADRFNKKAVHMARNLMRLGIRIPIVVDDTGRVINGVYRLFAAREAGHETWPVVEIDSAYGDLALNFLNYLSMDYDVNEDFADLLRYSAYRRASNNRGAVPKGMRFWANGEKTIIDRKSYTKDYWSNFRDTHGNSLLDFGAGLCRARSFLEGKGFDCLDFEPYRIDPELNNAKPSPAYSQSKAADFLQELSDGRSFDSIFLPSVLNSIPFAADRMAVLAIVHALCSFSTRVYGTSRDISDFDYEYSGLRNANYFVFDSEPGMRMGDSLGNPKVQKFHSQTETAQLLRHFWSGVQTWTGGNIHYWRANAPKRVNPGVLARAIEIEFDLPYSDRTRMGLVAEAKEVFMKRLKVKL